MMLHMMQPFYTGNVHIQVQVLWTKLLVKLGRKLLFELLEITEDPKFAPNSACLCTVCVIIIDHDRSLCSILRKYKLILSSSTGSRDLQQEHNTPERGMWTRDGNTQM